MPPRKATKRSAEIASKGPKEPKQIKKKPVIKTDLRQSSTGGVLLTFGQGDVGQLGLGEEVVEKIRPAVISGYQDIIAIAAGGMHNVCLRETGEILTFGCNDEGALGRDTSADGSETKPGSVTLPGKVIQVTAGDSHSAALIEDGRAFAWGSFRDSHGTMGLTLKGNERFPIEILPNIKIVKIASGADHLVLLSENGKIYTCGCGEQGQLGRLAARAASRNTRHGMGPLLSPGLVEFKITKKLEFGDVWAGTYCTFAKEYHSGDIYVFGLNNYYQMGLKDPVTQFHPQISKTFSGRTWRHISSGQHHSIALDDSGQVFVLGRKEYGRLGLGSNCSDAKELTPVPALSSFKCVDVAAGSAQSFAVTESGELYAWGMGSSGQLGTGEEEDVEEPILVKGKQLEGRIIVRVAGGGQHTLALATTGLIKEEHTDQ
ncbi:PREDICTED: regulator of chromosome condensation-like isoform X2 [Dufourea novaeangliae]|uniref:regulator of chromosome condensation-like isoform X2 n=1 Tax=Dufourea novaeangliae TaxID=178035 RepID=UPI00076790B8|nr:PREDICTED: regulator of chromosome condensation-like isoform X2 [Dufourea novaeangliae]